jgi:DNA repair protein RecN (Recombination protein N)
MLQQLIIRNYAIIDHLSLTPDPHLNIVTGETGAGKSIILGALSLILGERADTSVLINKAEKCVVEAHFEVGGNQAFRDALREAELDDEPQCIIRREIGVNGKSRAFINDTPVTLPVLNRLTSLLVDLHQQFDQLDIRNERFQLDVLDAMAGSAARTVEYRERYQEYTEISRQLSEHMARQMQLQQEADYKRYLLDELAQADFGENEIEQAAQQLKQMEHAERILQVLQAGRMALDEGEQPLTQEIRRLSQQFQGIMDVLPAVQPLQERTMSAFAELKDIAAELARLEDNVALDPEQMQRLQERVDLGYKLMKKHGVQDTAGLIALQHQLTGELQATQDLEDIIRREQAAQAQALKQLQDMGKKLSEQRKQAAPRLAERVCGLLALVGMPNARFDIVLDELPEPGPMGLDAVQFVLDANKSGQFLPVHKAASGGELSRIMLSIKSLTAQAMHLPTLIFDEVDTGISGEAARQVGVLLRELAESHQVICITHQPQVAAKGTQHFYVFKEAGADKRINTRVRVLPQDERIQAIARMIGGEQPSEAALQHARELVEA